MGRAHPISAFSNSFPPASTQPELAVSLNGADEPAGNLLDFGTVPVGGVVTCDDVITKPGDTDLLVRGVRLQVVGTLFQIIPDLTSFPMILSPLKNHPNPSQS
jgi:hypothetical protein